MSGSSIPGPARSHSSLTQQLSDAAASLFQLAGVLGATAVFDKHQQLDFSPNGFAKQLVRHFALRMGSPTFVHLDRQRVAEGLLARIDDPGLISQGGSLCGPAVFLFDAATRDPIQYAQFAIDLFERGTGHLGELEVTPGSDLREYSPPAGRVEECDWLALASIRDSENWFLDYDDIESIIEDLSGMTPPSELAGWFEKLGYREVLNETSIFFHHDQQHAQRASDLYRAGYRVCLLINDNLLYSERQSVPSGAADHWVALTSQISLLPLMTRCTVFSWGDGRRDVPQAGGGMPMWTFLQHYHGFVACRY